MPRSSADFLRLHGKPGWVYVARNDLMREDLYKVGCTGNQNPEVRTVQLNSEQRSGTSRLGFFNLVFAAAVLDAQGCEAALLRRVEVLRESRGKEFVNAPLELIIGEMLHIQKVDHSTARATAACPHCGTIGSMCPHPFIKTQCGACRDWFVFVAPGVLRPSTAQDRHTATYFAEDALHPTAHSPLATAFIGLRDAIRRLGRKEISAQEAGERMRHWIDYDPPLDRTPLLYQRTPRARPPRKPTTSRKGSPARPTVRPGAIECPDCLSAFPADEFSSCPECGWQTE